MKTGMVVRVFETGADAARTFNISPNAISACCHGRRFSAAGFQWRFAQREPSENIDRPTSQCTDSAEETSRVVPPPLPPPQVMSVRESVEQVDIATGAVLKVYPSIFEAARSLGVSSHVVLACCSGRRQFAGGYAWRYQKLPVPFRATEPSIDFPVHPIVPGLMRPSDAKRMPATPMIEQLDIVTREVIKEYTTCAEAARAAGLPINSITLCCLGRLNSAGGYHWRFKKYPQPAYVPSPTYPFPPRGVMPKSTEQRGSLYHALLVDSRPSVTFPPILPREEPQHPQSPEKTQTGESSEARETIPFEAAVETPPTLDILELEPEPEPRVSPLIFDSPPTTTPPISEVSVAVVTPAISPTAINTETTISISADILVVNATPFPNIVLSPLLAEDTLQDALSGPPPLFPI